MTTKLKISGCPLRVPKIRFKEFSSEWEEKIFKDFSVINQGLQIAISERFTQKVDNSYFYITNEFLKEGSDKKYFIKNPPESVLCNKDDLLMTRTGNTGKVVTGVEGAFHNNFFKIKYNKSIVDKMFIYDFLTSQKTQNKILSLAGTSTIPDLNHGDFYKIKINLPSLPEQQKIASFLSSAQEKIENIKEKKKSLEEYKKGVMQKIFSQEIRFKDENGEEFEDWEEKKLGELLDYEQPTNYIVKSEEYNDNYNIPVLTAGKTFILGYTNENFGIFEAKNNPIIIFDDFTTSKQFVNFDFKVKSSAMKILKNIDDKISNIKYIFEFMETIKFSLGDEHKRYWISEYSKININLPTLKEQEKIADFLSGIDEKIEKVGDEIEKMEEFKKGLLQGMFV